MVRTEEGEISTLPLSELGSHPGLLFQFLLLSLHSLAARSHFTLFGSQFHHLKNGNNNPNLAAVFGRITEIAQRKHLAQH